MLAGHGQYLPFDPVMVERGGTLGGAVAAGLSGPGRYFSGGLRDFLLGVQFIDAQGDLVRAGGKVVKNAAGFDLSKFMVGSLGQYGLLVELTFKVFPKPGAYLTLVADYDELEEARQAVIALSKSPLEIHALEMEPGSHGYRVLARLGGPSSALSARFQRLRQMLGRGEQLPEDQEADTWRNLREFAWLPTDSALVKIPLIPSLVPDFEKAMRPLAARRHYSVGLNLAWIAWQEPIEDLEKILYSFKPEALSGLVITGPPGRTRLGARRGEAFERRIKQALDPSGRWAEA
jgi:glycolate oxidase FAD binding subunit